MHHRSFVSRRKHQLVPDFQFSGLDPAGDDPAIVEPINILNTKAQRKIRRRLPAASKDRSASSTCRSADTISFSRSALRHFRPALAEAGINARGSKLKTARNCRYSFSISRNRSSEKSARSILFTTTINCANPEQTQQIGVAPALFPHAFIGGDHQNGRIRIATRR